MSISSHLARYFSPGVRQRGSGYFREGRVRLRHGSAGEFEGSVRGTEAYDVAIAVAGNELRLYCDCAFFATDGPCKHLWAAILAAEKLHYLTEAAGVTRLDDEHDTPVLLGAEPGRLAGGLVPPWRSRLNE